MSFITAPEQWRPVLGYEGAYEVSDLGRVRSLKRVVDAARGARREIPGLIMKARLNAQGYPVISLSRLNVSRVLSIHVLVCEAWHGPRPEGMVARHLDDVKTNLSPSNLSWGTLTQNSRDAIRNGRNVNASKTVCANGHAYTERDTTRNQAGHRICRQCALVRSHQNRDIKCSYDDFCDAISHRETGRRERPRLTHCRRGHSMADAYESPAGARNCRVCLKKRESERVWTH